MPEQILFQEILKRLQHQDEEMAAMKAMNQEIVRQTRATNGRVTKLEEDKIAEDARVDERAKMLEEISKERAADLKAQGDRQNQKISRNQWLISTGVVVGLGIFTALIGLVAAHV